MKKEQGITLVALVITVIVLMILAVIAIQTVTKKEIVSEAIGTKNAYEQAQDSEDSTLGSYTDFIREEKLNAQNQNELIFNVCGGENEDIVIYTFKLYPAKGITWGEWVGADGIQAPLGSSAPFQSIRLRINTSNNTMEVGIMPKNQTGGIVINYTYVTDLQGNIKLRNELITGGTYTIPYVWNDVD